MSVDQCLGAGREVDFSGRCVDGGVVVAQPREHARDIAVKHGDLLPKSQRRHRGRRIAADAGEGSKGSAGGWKHAIMIRGDNLCGLVQVAPARGVAKP